MIAVVRNFFDPLRLHCFLNILGDVFIMMSGMAYHNPIRSISALCGASTHIFGIIFSKNKILGFAATDIVMSVVILCGLLYMLSGTNLMGFETTPRYAEIFGGLCVSSAAICVILQKSKLAAILFTLSTTSFFLSAFEVLLARGEADWFVFMASLMFYSAGLVAAFIKKKE